MSIIELQKRQREIGRLRLGTKGPKGNPVKLGTWRLTSPNRTLLDAAAEQWGGKVEQWADSWELITKAVRIPVMVPAQDIERSQYLELWSQGGLQRRCDGQDCWLPDGEIVPCICHATDKKECSPSTTFRFWLHTLPALGVWILRSTGWNAAAELGSDVAMLAGKSVIVNLAVERREVKHPGKPVQRFVVPVLETGVSLESLLGAAGDPARTAGLPSRAGGTALSSAPPPPPMPALPAITAPFEPEPEPAFEEPELLAPEPQCEGTETTEADDQNGFDTVIPLAPEASRKVGEEQPSLAGSGADDLFGSFGKRTQQAAVERVREMLVEVPLAGTAMFAREQTEGLFRAMEQAGLWRATALPAALSKRGMMRLEDLRTKVKSDQFMNESWRAARTALALFDGEGEG